MPGVVIETDCDFGSRPSPARRSMRPWSPNDPTGLPVRASRQYRYCRHATNSRLSSILGQDRPFVQYERPRLRTLPLTLFPSFGSNAQRSFPVAASSAITRSLGVVAYRIPLTTSGLHCISEPGNASPVSKVQATWSLPTLSRLI